jgi:hypothetical protein
MTTEDIIYHIFYRVDEQMLEIGKHPDAKLYPSEVVTIGILFALKGGHFRAVYGYYHACGIGGLNGTMQHCSEDCQTEVRYKNN